MTVQDTMQDTAHVMHIMDKTGDTKVIWSADNPDEVEAARNTFDELVGEKKFLAYKVKKDGTKGEVIRKFDKTAERIILAPQLVGG
jgi:tRNA U38,U39,U40 pseudouridine synthase TruA